MTASCAWPTSAFSERQKHSYTQRKGLSSDDTQDAEEGMRKEGVSDMYGRQLGPHERRSEA